MVDMSTFSVLDAFSLFRRELGLLRANEMKALEFGPKQMMILYRLTLSKATMGELAEYTASDKASATRAVSSLESAGLVRRQDHDEDRRIIIIELTNKGRSKAAEAVKLRKKIGERVNGALNQSEQKTLAALLARAANSLKELRQSK